jgi:hypothetical protein
MAVTIEDVRKFLKENSSKDPRSTLNRLNGMLREPEKKKDAPKPGAEKVTYRKREKPGE